MRYLLDYIADLLKTNLEDGSLKDRREKRLQLDQRRPVWDED